MNTPLRCAVDASAAIKLFVPEPCSQDAVALFAHLGDPDAHFCAPSLLYAECANILWKYRRRFGLDAREASRSLAALTVLPIDCVEIKQIISEAHEIAMDCDISAYDACYAATARQRGVPLITADARLAEKLEGKKPEVLLLGRFAIPPVPSV